MLSRVNIRLKPKVLERKHLCLLKRLLSSEVRPPRVCIIGSGPAGFYTAQQLLRNDKSVVVDIFERMPVPFGLVRFGVAPDHPEVKNVVNTFHTIARNERCNFFGNVDIGVDIKTKELRDMYDAVVLAYGADKDKTLGIKGEDLDGVISARSFVGWYNGMPAQQDLNPDLTGDTAVVVGHGNVAVDVARILLSPYDLIKYTDICDYALDLLKTSKIRNVIVAGRRGPIEASFTIKEIREMINLPNCKTNFRQEDFFHAKAMLDSLPRPKKRIVELMCKTAFKEHSEEDSSKRNNFSTIFFRSPVEILNKNGTNKVNGIKFEVNKLVTADDGTQKAVGTGQFEEIKCSLVLRSIGYKSVRVDEGIPFDTKMGIIPNVNGRVIETAGSDSVVKGLYCSGWVKHGPVGVILTTMTEAKSTANAISEDLNNIKQCKAITTEEVNAYLASKGIQAVSFIDWEKIDAEETKRGHELQKPREKIVSKEEMLQVALKEQS